MKILHILKHCNFACGNVHAAIDLACEQVKQKHDVFFVSAGGHLENLLIENQVNCIFLENLSKNPLKNLLIIYRFFVLLLKIKPDIIHAHMMSSAILGWVAGRLLGIPLVTTVHNSFDKHSVIMRLGDRVIAVSNAVAIEMNKKGIPLNILRVVLNGTLGVKRRLSINQKFDIQLNRPSIVTICGLHPRKGVNYLIDAFDKSYKNINLDSHLYIVGAGPNRAEYEQQASKLESNKNIHFLGAIEDTVSVLNQTDIFVLASLAEPAGLVLSEAREAGAAIIASNVGGIPEMLDDGEAGILVEVKNADHISKNLTKLLLNKELLSHHKERARKNVDKFHISRATNQTVQVYEELTGS